MPNIIARVGSTNVVRVLSNASAPPTRLVNLTDIDSTLKTRDGMILVWDLATEKFYMTDTIDSSSLNITGIATFLNTTNSLAPTNGALVINGGLGVAKRVNIGEGITVAGVSTFASNLDINAAVDILNGLTVNSTLNVSGASTFDSNLEINAAFKSVGVTTLASNGGITTTGGDLYIGGDLYVNDDITFDEFNARNSNITGISTVGTTLDVNGTLDVDGRTELDITNISETLNVSGVSTFGSNLDINAAVDILNELTVNSTFKSVGITTLASAGGITTTGGELYVGTNLEVAGTSNFIGDATFRGGTIGIGDSTGDDIDVGGEFVSNLVPNTDNTFDIGITTQRWRDGKFSGIVTTTRLNSSGQSQLNNLNVSGVATFASAVDFNGSVDIDGHIEVDNLNVSGISTFAGAIDANGNLDVDGHTELDNVNISGVSTFTNDINVTGDLRVTGFASVTQGLYYDSNDYDGPNGIAYFDNTGKLIGAASTENAVTETYFILTTNNVGIPTWTSTIDGGSF
jgi:hypothetical protein|tara:strand:+ start:1407 stop:2954 length:1548 start_codon:yes stop_codon:yes gene_type:complete